MITATEQGSRRIGRGRTKWSDLALRYGMVLLLVVLVIVAQIAYPQFLTLNNLQNTITQNASTAVVAIGMTFVIIGGGFDLSVSGTFGLGSVVYAGLVLAGLPVIAALACALLAGLLCGVVNGLVITKLKVNAFVATLGSGAAFLGAAALVSGSRPVTVPPVPTFNLLGAGSIGGVSIEVLIILVLYVVAAIVLSKSVYGRGLYAVGGSRESARLAGLAVDRIQIIAFIVCGGLAALAGILLASTLSVGQFDQGSTVALDSIAAVVVGGTSLYGGDGAIWRTAVGVAILATMNNLFSSMSIASPTQNIIKGAVLVAAVAFEVVVRKVTARQ
jgi:ribose transport system permease protein